MTYTDDVVRVHVENASELHTVRTEEREPEHFVFSTFTLIPGQTINSEVLMLDPMRKGASLLAIDAAIVLCHSATQAASAANQVAGLPDPDGAYVPQGVSVALSGTGPAWFAGPTATRVSLIINRRGQ
jgi:hypothetical protein